MTIADAGKRARPGSIGPTTAGPGYARYGKYLRFAIPAFAVIAAVIVFPWLFTLYMSVHDWRVGQSETFIGLDNYANLLNDSRFLEAVAHTLYYTALAIVLPTVLG